jgi:hypothetical protein
MNMFDPLPPFQTYIQFLDPYIQMVDFIQIYVFILDLLIFSPHL